MEELILTAIKAMNNAYSPYSNFKVGSAVLTECGKMFTGCNIENASYPATICAERVAMTKAVSEGYTNLVKIAIVCSNGDYAYPCGVCRQVMSELMPDGEVLVYSSNENKVKQYKVSELLPYAFDKNNLEEK